MEKELTEKNEYVIIVKDLYGCTGIHEDTSLYAELEAAT